MPGRAKITMLAALAVLMALAAAPADARPILTKEGVLPAGTDLNEDRLDQPTERFFSELAGGKRSYLLNLGDRLFSSPDIFGGVARQARMSCETCHQQGANSPKLFVPGLSRRPGTFDVSNHLFNAKGDNGVFDPVTPPSLRGAKYLAPYAHDGRFPTLREFIRNAIVNEFAGLEPSTQVLDALETYVKEIAFLPNPKLGPGGRLTAKASAAARRGEKLFNRPFPRDAALSCASCHKPDGAFVDHTLHDVGTGGWFKTPTLINADFNAPYFHDGRFDSYAEVVHYFDKHFALHLNTNERADLIAYLDAVGDAEQPVTPNTVEAELGEIAQFVSVLDTAIPERNKEVIDLTVDAVASEWR
jgi:cytochrome c peroxidase